MILDIIIILMLLAVLLERPQQKEEPLSLPAKIGAITVGIIIVTGATLL